MLVEVASVIHMRLVAVVISSPRATPGMGCRAHVVEVDVYPVTAAEGWFPPRPGWLDTALNEAGLETQPEPQDLSVMCVPFGVPDAVERIRERLYYTMGDSDLF